MHICEIKILIIVRWDRNSEVLLVAASFQTNQVERENHKPRPTSIQCSSIIFMHFLLFAKLGGWNCKVSRISWLPSKLIATIHEPFFVFVLPLCFQSQELPTWNFFQKSTINEPEPKLIVQVRKLFKAEIFNTKGGENWPSFSSYFFFHLWMLFVLFGQVFFSTLSCSSSTWDLWELFVSIQREFYLHSLAWLKGIFTYLSSKELLPEPQLKVPPAHERQAA